MRDSNPHLLLCNHALPSTLCKLPYLTRNSKLSHLQKVFGREGRGSSFLEIKTLLPLHYLPPPSALMSAGTEPCTSFLSAISYCKLLSNLLFPLSLRTHLHYYFKGKLLSMKQARIHFSLALTLWEMRCFIY